MSEHSDYYVYVYIDPRNHGEFYYGKGQGSRKVAHLSDDSDSKKAERIKKIHSEGESPIIKVIAKGLTEQEAYLVEKTLIWKLGRNLVNQGTGHFADNFRPHDKLHLNLAGFDFQNSLYYVNVGEGPYRVWEDYRRFGFNVAGQGKHWSDPMRKFEPGDVVVAYLKGSGYVGVGKVVARAVRISEFINSGQKLSAEMLTSERPFENQEDPNLSEYLVKVQWEKTVSAKEAKWKSKAGLFTSQLIRASLISQALTRAYIEKEFDVDLEEILSRDLTGSS